MGAGTCCEGPCVLAGGAGEHSPPTNSTRAGEHGPGGAQRAGGASDAAGGMHRVLERSVQKLPGCQKPREMGTFPAPGVGNLGCQWCSDRNGAQDTEFVWSGLRAIAAGHKGDTVQQVQGLCCGWFHKQQTQCAEQWWLESTLRWGEDRGRSLHMYTGNRGYTCTRHGTGTRVCSQ